MKSPSDLKAQVCLPNGSCIGSTDTCCSGVYAFDLTCPVTETRCAACDSGENCCTCTVVPPVGGGGGICDVNLGVNNCSSGFVPICPDKTSCSETPSCACQPTSITDCGEENEVCCGGGNSCFDPLVCVNLGGSGSGDFARCLRPCDSASDCNSSAEEVCTNGGCTANPFAPPSEFKIKIFCDSSGEPSTENKGRLYTAIGCIPFMTGNVFIRFILSWGIGIAGGIAFILIIVAAFQIITSSGDPKKLQAGRELMTSAIAGLVLLIFSVLILRIIGVNILGIPGFGS